MNNCDHEPHFAALREAFGIARIAERMSYVADTLDDLTARVTAVSAAVGRLAADYGALKQSLANGSLTADQQAALDAADASLQAVADEINSTDPAPAEQAPAEEAAPAENGAADEADGEAAAPAAA